MLRVFFLVFRVLLGPGFFLRVGMLDSVSFFLLGVEDLVVSVGIGGRHGGVTVMRQEKSSKRETRASNKQIDRDSDIKRNREKQLQKKNTDTG